MSTLTNILRRFIPASLDLDLSIKVLLVMFEGLDGDEIHPNALPIGNLPHTTSLQARPHCFSYLYRSLEEYWFATNHSRSEPW